MNQPSEVNTNSGNARGDDTRRNKASPPASDARSEAREPAKEAVHQVTPRDDVKKPYTPSPAKAPGTNPQAARGDDDLMSQQERRK